MQDFRNLKVWGKAHAFTLAVYKATVDFPTEERYGLTSQLRRSSASIPANIAEGCGRDSDPEFARFVRIAMGSAFECDYHLELAHDLEFLKDGDYTRLVGQVAEIRHMLNALLQRLKATGQQ